ncbi:MAG TPA: hypothetical protein DGG94_18555, partial [Micromonosporaceae bacterium]|nr:hypothetical protein [Micromonosporaceae bacterium]
MRAAAASSTMSDEQAEWRMMRGLPVGSSNESGVSAVDVTVLDQTATARLGVKGVVFTAAPSSSSATAGSAPVEFSVSYQAFGHAYGGGYADRLRLVSLPACALSTPQLPACQVQTPVPAGFNDNLTATVSAPVDLASGGGSSPASTGPASASESSSTSDSASDAGGVQVLAVTAGASSEQGDWGATSLSQAGSWQAGSSGGGFSYSVPVTVPPA